jgi:transaldolase
VSIEVDPNLADDAAATVEEAISLHEAVARRNLLVKIPATDAAVVAIEEMVALGRSVNATLIFSLARHREVIEAYMRGLERLVEHGGDPRTVHSVASFFVSRVDAETDRRLTAVGRPDLKGLLGVANAKLAYQQYGHLFSRPRWERLAARGATKQRCLWASVSAKDRAYRDTLYVEELAGPDTISTMPRGTIEAFQDHGIAELRLETELDKARGVFDALAETGVDYADVVAKLEREGVETFVASFNELLKLVADKRHRVAAAA